MGEEEEGDHEEREDDSRVLGETVHLLQEPEQRHHLDGGSFNLAILTRRASLRISTEVSDSCRIRNIALVNSSVISKRLDIVLT